MVLNAAVQMLREAEELKQNILKFKSDTSMLQERSLWSLQQQLQKLYQKVLVLDLDYALDKKVEQDLWNVGFKQQIEALQAISKDRKSPLRSEGLAMLSWVLQAAAGFYLCLLHQICTTFKLDLPFRRRASLLGWVEGWSPGPASVGPQLPPPAAARYICQHCLVHLGDLARYRQQPRVAYTFYRHALVVSPHSGQPYNQLALLARRRGRRLGALYWHVRAILVRAPFPPAPANLTRTLQALAGSAPAPPPVLLGARSRSVAAPPAAPRDAHGYFTVLVRALHDIHAGERLESAEQLVETLNTSLTSLVATDTFESMTLIKMMCVIIWLVHATTDELTASESSLSDSEATAAALSQTLAAGAMLALLLPSHTADTPPSRAMPALKVCLQWAVLYPQLLGSAPFASRPQLWHALAHALNKLPRDGQHKYESVPLPEDEELHGFQPLERSFEELKFCDHATWDTYGRRVPDVEQEKPLDLDEPPPSVVSPESLNGDPELEASVRAHRLLVLGMRLAELMPEHFCFTMNEDDTPSFSALCRGGEQLTRCVDAVRRARDDDAPPPPVVISEADFREKVRDQRVGILKPQGSLERAREERALATTEEQDLEECATFKEGRCDDKREARRPRVNIAMAAILRKQEESCKQVKFKTPPPVAEETDTEATQDTAAADASVLNRPKSISKPQKSLSDIPLGRKTGGILALKDKSGYPHLVDIPPDATKRKEEKTPEKDPKVIQPPSQRSQSKWNQQTRDHNRATQGNYGLQSAGISYSPNYSSPQAGNMNIRLPVVNPKEIDVRSAALQKQNSRGEYAHRSANYMSSDKKQFLNDLPPRFAQQRWAQENEENKFRDDEFRIQSLNWSMNANMFSTPPPNWLGMQPPLPQLPSQLTSQQSSPNSQLSHSQIGIGSQIPPQLGQMTHPSAQISQYPPPQPLSDFIPQWWKSNQAFNPSSTNANMTQQFYPQMSAPGPSYSQMAPAQTQHKPETTQSFMRPSAIGQMPNRHIPPPGYNSLGFGYPNIFEQFSNAELQHARSFLEESYPSLDMGRHVPLDLSTSTSNTPFEPGYERGLDRKEEALEPTPSPLDLSATAEEPTSVGRGTTPVDDPGTYSLFSGAPGAVTWGNVTQNQQDSSDWIPTWALWHHFMQHPPLPVEQSPPPSPVRNRTRRCCKAVKPKHPYHRRP